MSYLLSRFLRFSSFFSFPLSSSTNLGRPGQRWRATDRFFCRFGPADSFFCHFAPRGQIGSNRSHRAFSTASGKEEGAEAKEEQQETNKQEPDKQPAKAGRKKAVDGDGQRTFQFQEVYLAHHRIRSGVIETPTRHSEFLSEITGCQIFTKKEILQYTGSFKERGARNAILCLQETNPEQLKRGVISASAGNHALALAWHGRQLGVPVTVVMPHIAPMQKVNRCRKYGADVIIHGAHIGESRKKADELAQTKGQAYINGFNDYSIIAGAGTVGVEILAQVPDVDAIVVPIGGGGLIAGIATVVKTIRPQTLVIGVEPINAASWTEALKHGAPTITPISNTLADGLAVPQVGSQAFEIGKDLIDEVVMVKEKDIALAILRLVEMEKSIVEGAGAAGVAALLPTGPLFGNSALKGKKVVVPLCGGNIDTNVLGRVLERGLAADDRLVRFICEVSDLPGGISRLTTVLSNVGVSIKDIFHERAWVQSSVQMVAVQMVCETTGAEHVARLKAALTEHGYTPHFGPSIPYPKSNAAMK